MTKIAFVDTETMGLDIDLHAVWEIGLIVRDEVEGSGETFDTEHRWMLPVENLAFADPFALRLNGFHDRHPQGLKFIDPKDGRTSKIAEDFGVTELEKFSKQFISLTRGAHWVGNVPSFDEERIRRIVRSQGLLQDWHYQLHDIEDLAIAYSYGRKHEYRKKGEKPSIQPFDFPIDSDALFEAYGVKNDAAHTALGDAKAVRDLYDKVMV